jgi:hypothetical protein
VKRGREGGGRGDLIVCVDQKPSPSPPLPPLPSASKYNNNKGSIYMVFDYMDHDLAGLMERRG